MAAYQRLRTGRGGMTQPHDEPQQAMPIILSVKGLAEYLQVPEQTVYRWNSQGTGPRFIKVGKHVRYRLDDITRWLDTRASHDTGSIVV